VRPSVVDSLRSPLGATSSGSGTRPAMPLVITSRCAVRIYGKDSIRCIANLPDLGWRVLAAKLAKSYTKRQRRTQKSGFPTSLFP
jgi:hypothetical protein